MNQFAFKLAVFQSAMVGLFGDLDDLATADAGGQNEFVHR